MLEMVITARAADLGHGLTVRRVLPYAKRRMVGPFIFWDHAGPVTLSREAIAGADVRPHPHIGLATVSYLLSGSMTHRDSLGTVLDIRPGDVNWMTAGRGISHSERTEPEMRAKGFRMHGVQTWVALPKTHEETEPAFEHVEAAKLPAWSERGVAQRLIVGTYVGRTAPTTHFSPIFYVGVEAAAGGRLAVSPEHAERAIYLADGSLTVGDRTLGVGDLAVLAPGQAVEAVAGPAGAKAMLLGGATMDGPRHIWWNFVSSSKERLEKAKTDWRDQRFPKVPGDNEFIPLPDR